MNRRVTVRPTRIALAPWFALASAAQVPLAFAQTPQPPAVPSAGTPDAPIQAPAPSATAPIAPAPSAPAPTAPAPNAPAQPSPPASVAPSEAPTVPPTDATALPPGTVTPDATLGPAEYPLAEGEVVEEVPTDAPPDKALGSVVVTAQRREESIQSVPAAVSVLGGENIINTGIGRSAKEVLDFVPNASAVTQGHGRPRWWIRGVGTGQQQLDFSNPVGFYLDDVFISNATATGFPLFDLDRVEILRGPQGTLWGKNTTGGAINVISRKPDFSHDGYFKYDHGRFQTNIFEGAAGAPIWEDKLAARVSFHYEDHGGRFKNQNTGRRDGQLTDGAGRLQLLWKVSPKFEALANIHVRRYTTAGSTSTVTGNGPDGEYLAGYVPSKNALHVSSNAPSSSDISQTGVLLNLKGELGDYSLVSISGWESFRQHSLSDSDNTPLEINRGWGRSGSYQFSEEVRISSPREDRVNWIAGLYGLAENIENESASARLPGVADAVPGPSNYSYSTYDHDTQTFAAFASVTGNITDALSVTGGLRWTVEHRTLDLSRYQSSGAQFSNVSQWWEPTSVSTPFDNQFSADPEKTWNNWTGDLTPEFKINKDALVYLRYAHGVKSGGFNTSATSLVALNTVEPETLDNFELGAKTSFFDNRLTVNATGFYYIYSDIQVNVVGPLPPTNVAVSYLQNVKEGRAYGAEFEVETRPIENLQFTGNLGLLDTEFTDFTVLNGGPDYSGNRFVRSPSLTTLLRGNWSIPLPGDRQPIVHLSGDWRYQSRQVHFTTNQDNPLLQSRPWSNINLRLSLKSHDEKLILTGYVNNLLNAKTLSHSLPGAQGSTGAVAIWGEPITFGGFLTARWY